MTHHILTTMPEVLIVANSIVNNDLPQTDCQTLLWVNKLCILISGASIVRRGYNLSQGRPVTPLVWDDPKNLQNLKQVTKLMNMHMNIFKDFTCKGVFLQCIASLT